MNDDAQRLLFIVAYAGSDAGRAALETFLDDVARLRRIEEAARDVVNIALNDAGPEAFATMADLRATLASPTQRAANSTAIPEASEGNER